MSSRAQPVVSPLVSFVAHPVAAVDTSSICAVQDLFEAWLRHARYGLVMESYNTFCHNGVDRSIPD